MADCFNCKHRHHMVCIPESRDCEKVYLLDDHDVFEVNNDKCDFYDRRDIVYDFGAMYGALRFTRDIFECSIDLDNVSIFNRIFAFNPCIIIVNGIAYNLSDHNIKNLEVRFNNNPSARDDGRHIMDISIKFEVYPEKYSYDIKMIAKVVTVRYNKETNAVIINGIGYLEEDQ